MLSVKDGLDAEEARPTTKGLRVGSAPDTFLGGAHQQARDLIDNGKLGKITAGTCHVMSHGMEHWHPNPDFFFQPGGGPMLDLGPYYITNLIQLIGPVKRVAALAIDAADASAPSPTARATARRSRSRRRPPSTRCWNSHNGATITLSTQLGRLGARPRADGALRRRGLAATCPTRTSSAATCSRPQGATAVTRGCRPGTIRSACRTRSTRQGTTANYRTAGLADMAIGHPSRAATHRCSLDRALHAVDVMTAILKSGETGTFVDS